MYVLRNYRTGRMSFFDYDHAGRCMACREFAFTVTDGQVTLGAQLSGYGYQYDANNNLTKLTCTAAGSTWDTVYVYDKDNRPKTATFANSKVLTHIYDGLGRLTRKRLGLSSNYDAVLTYHNGANDSKTALLATYQNGSDTAYAYAYDDNGNTASITRGSTSVTYEYNGANELIRENNGFTGQTVTYEYDDWGNLTEKKIYAYTTAENPGTPTDTKTYDYDNTDWGDQLTGYNGQTIAYDAMGNPTMYRGKTLTWRGKQLTGIADGTDTISYVYDSNGLRQKKTVNGTDTNYYYNGSVLIGMQQGTNALRFSYDAAGAVAAVDFNGTYYYYVRNGQGDVVKLIDGSRNTVVEYTYDSWGKLLSCTGTLATSLGALNPFRYRGYVYDSETGFYYLKSRYYDPETCRFISADVLLSTGQGVLGHNCYAYCLNNPVNRSDNSGHSSRIPNYIDRGSGGTSRSGESQAFGFIESQSDPSVASIRFGIFGNVKANGCGAIAIYNVKVAANKCTYSFDEYMSLFRLQHMDLAFGLLGTNPLGVGVYLSRCFGSSNVDYFVNQESAENYDALIFLYFWRNKQSGGIGGHYFAATKNEDGIFSVHNSHLNETADALTIWDSFGEDDSLWRSEPFVWGITFGE